MGYTLERQEVEDGVTGRNWHILLPSKRADLKAITYVCLVQKMFLVQDI